MMNIVEDWKERLMSNRFKLIHKQKDGTGGDGSVIGEYASEEECRAAWMRLNGIEAPPFVRDGYSTGAFEQAEMLDSVTCTRSAL